MKKILISAVAALLVSGGALAVQGGKAQVGSNFAPVSWTSESPEDVRQIKNGAGSGSLARVLISVAPSYFQSARTGIKIQNCGPIDHIDAGSSVFCTLPTNPETPISFSSDTKGVAASGTYQVEMP